MKLKTNFLSSSRCICFQKKKKSYFPCSLYFSPIIRYKAYRYRSFSSKRITHDLIIIIFSPVFPSQKNIFNFKNTNSDCVTNRQIFVFTQKTFHDGIFFGKEIKGRSFLDKLKIKEITKKMDLSYVNSIRWKFTFNSDNKAFKREEVEETNRGKSVISLKIILLGL